MIKARFTTEQRPVRIINDKNKVYVFICLNGTSGTNIIDGSNGNQETENFIEYDYNEFTAEAEAIDINDIKSNPEKYLNYPLPEVTELEQLRADIDYLLMLNE